MGRGGPELILMKLYLAGPMTGIPKFNYPAFEAAAEALRQKGHEVVSPAEMDSDEIKAISMASPDGKWGGNELAGDTWGDMLARGS